MAVISDFCVGGKTVTGGDKGLGLETCRRLFHGGARVILACRDKRPFGPQQEGFRQELFRTIQCENLRKPEIMKVDLSSLKSVFDFCSHFQSKFSRLDVLVCNAGIMTPADDATTEELDMGVNHLAHFYMFQLLKDLLLKMPGARVVIVSSMLLKEGQLDIEQLQVNGAESIVFCAAGSSKATDPIRGRFIRDRVVKESIEQLPERSEGYRETLSEMSEQIIQIIMNKYR
jgi:NAD(P)-dependent dehydrogenase (short-subunit alcohol dehydrogenase family)